MLNEIFLIKPLVLLVKMIHNLIAVVLHTRLKNSCAEIALFSHRHNSASLLKLAYSRAYLIYIVIILRQSFTMLL
jgi:hypothetical protein